MYQTETFDGGLEKVQHYAFSKGFFKLERNLFVTYLFVLFVILQEKIF